MIFKQYYLGCLSHASYLVADEATTVAVIVDPQRDIDLYLRDASAIGLAIRHVVLTHFHADFVAGHLELRAKTGATIHLGARASAEFPFEPLGDGDAIELGAVRLVALETPGHTPEAISILVYDLTKDPNTPHAVLTGDTLFIGDVGRPDLMASIGVSANDLARELYASLREKILPLPDATLVYPAHGAGSMCGKNLSQETFSTLGEQRAHNYALQPMSEQAFVRLVTADQPPPPRYFARAADLNRRERSTLESVLAREMKPLSLDAFLRESAGAEVLDVRDPIEFERAHVAGSVNIGLGGKFATWAGTLLAPDRPILIVAEPGKENEAAMRLARVGFDGVVGFLDGGMRGLDARPDLVRSTRRVDANTLVRELEAEDAPLVLDVRNEGEWNDAHLAESLNIPLGQLEERLDEIPRDRRLAVHCATGYRSAIAASLLERHGRNDLADVEGGIAAWRAAGLPTLAHV